MRGRNFTLSNGEQYKSLTQLAKAYKINRTSLSIELSKVDNIDEALNNIIKAKEYRALLKENFGEVSLDKICSKYNIGTGTVRKYIDSGVDVIDAIKITINNKEKRDSNNIVVRGKFFKNISKCCKHFNIRYSTIYAICKDKDISNV